jgi:hypothetical protein
VYLQDDDPIFIPQPRKPPYPWSVKKIVSPPTPLGSSSVSQPSSSSPFSRHGHTLCAADDELYLFGGLEKSLLNDFHVIGAEYYTFQLQTTDEVPPPRVGHACTMLDDKTLAVWGGKIITDEWIPYSPWEITYDNKLYLLNICMLVCFTLVIPCF